MLFTNLLADLVIDCNQTNEITKSIADQYCYIYACLFLAEFSIVLGLVEECVHSTVLGDGGAGSTPALAAAEAFAYEHACSIRVQ